jgi:hypothetical protein
MSLPGGLGGDKDPSLIATNKIETWFFTGDQDTTAAPQVTKDAYALCNKVYPSSSRITVYPGGHGGWNAFYDPKWKDGISIQAIKNQVPASMRFAPTPSLSNLSILSTSSSVKCSLSGSMYLGNS